jgi:predicted secreted protein
MKITVGTQIKHYNGENPTGYIWTIIVIEGKKLHIESKEGDQVIKETITANDLRQLLAMGYYSIVN